MLRGPQALTTAKSRPQSPKRWSAQEQPDAVKSASAGTGVALYNPENRILRCMFGGLCGLSMSFHVPDFSRGEGRGVRNLSAVAALKTGCRLVIGMSVCAYTYLDRYTGI